MQHRPVRTMAALAAALVAGAVLSAAPASADCVSAEVSYKRPNQTKQYVVGPKTCVVSTPFPEGPDVWLTPGEPSLIVVDVHVWTAAP